MTAARLVDGERTVQSLLADLAAPVPIDVALAIALRAAAAVRDRHGGYAPDYGTLSPARIVIDFAGDIRIGDGQPDDTCRAPEQLAGGRIDRRTDVYALGVVLHHLVMSRRDNRDVPPAVDALIAKAVAESPLDRFQTAIAFHGALDRLATGLGAKTGANVISTYMVNQLGLPEIPRRARILDSAIPTAIVDGAVTARIPLAMPLAKPLRIVPLPVVAPVETRVRPRTVQIPVAPATIAVGTQQHLRPPAEPVDAGWDVPIDDDDVVELEDADLELDLSTTA